MARRSASRGLGTPAFRQDMAWRVRYWTRLVQGHLPWHLVSAHWNRLLVTGPACPQFCGCAQLWKVPPLPRQVTQQAQLLSIAHALTSLQHIILEQLVHALSPAAGAQAPPPEELLDAGPALLVLVPPPAQAAPQFCEAQVTKAWVVVS